MNSEEVEQTMTADIITLHREPPDDDNDGLHIEKTVLGFYRASSTIFDERGLPYSPLVSCGHCGEQHEPDIGPWPMVAGTQDTLCEGCIDSSKPAGLLRSILDAASARFGAAMLHEGLDWPDKNEMTR